MVDVVHSCEFTQSLQFLTIKLCNFYILKDQSSQVELLETLGTCEISELFSEFF